MARVNPPPQLKIPKQFLKDKEVRDYLQQRDWIQFQMWKRIGGSEDIVSQANQFITTNQSALNEINNRLGSGDALTSDDTGFTVDLDTLSVDMTEA